MCCMCIVACILMYIENMYLFRLPPQTPAIPLYSSLWDRCTRFTNDSARR